MSNTQVAYLYRDACNFKAYGGAVFTGPPDPALVARLLAARDDDQFLVPEQVGLEHPGNSMGERFPDEEDDHGFVELEADDITEVTTAPTDGRTFAEFVDACEAAAETGWDPDLAISAAGGWTDPDIAARLRGGVE